MQQVRVDWILSQEQQVTLDIVSQQYIILQAQPGIRDKGYAGGN